MTPTEQISPDSVDVPKSADLVKGVDVPKDDRTQIRDFTGDRSSPAGAALVPKVLKSRFVLQDQLGSGGMGTVYRAKDLRKVEARDSQPYLAIKVLNSDFREHPDAFIALQREAAKSQSLSHRNIVKIFDFDKEGDVPFMTMELLQGNELADLLREYPQGLPESLAWPVIRGFCSALKHAHAEGVIHADLKPGNLFVTHAGQVKIFDFGLARAVQSNFSSGVFETRSDVEDLIFDTAALGALTPAFASRAMLQGEAPNASDDVFAAALVIYQVLTGRHPFNRIPADKVDPRSALPERPKQLSSRQWRALSQALSLEEERRLPSIAALQAALFDRSLWPMRFLAAGLGMVAVTLWYFNVQKDDQILVVQEQAQKAGRVEAGVDRILELIENPHFDDGWERRVDDELKRLAALEDSADVLANAKQQVARLYADKSIASPSIEAAVQIAERGEVFGDMRLARQSIGQRLLARFESHLDNAVPSEEWIQTTERLLSQLSLSSKSPHDLEIARVNANASYLALLRGGEVGLSDQAVDLLEQILLRQEFDVDYVTVALETRSSAAEQVVEEIRRDQAKLDVENFGQEFLRQGCLVSGLDRLQAVHKSMGELARVSRAALAARTDELLAACVKRLGSTDPDAAASLQKESAARFGLLPRTQDVSIDPCDRNYLVGSGAQRGRTGRCIDSGSLMPELVVVPGLVSSYAVTRYEISNAEFSQFCQVTQRESCVEGDPRLPATEISVAEVAAFADWLTERSGYRYRLPTLEEWRAAASPDGHALDANRNCKVDVGGVTRGGSPVPVTLGRLNQFGLVNAYGNAAEWVLDGDQLRTVGGSFNDPIELCTDLNPKVSDGEPSVSQGFRLVREISPFGEASQS